MNIFFELHEIFLIKKGVNGLMKCRALYINNILISSKKKYTRYIKKDFEYYFVSRRSCKLVLQISSHVPISNKLDDTNAYIKLEIEYFKTFQTSFFSSIL